MNKKRLWIEGKDGKYRDKSGNIRCPHGIQRNRCKECGGNGVCKHNRRRGHCKDCGGGSICCHNRIRSVCKECGGGSICEHSSVRSHCVKCRPENVYKIYQNVAIRKKRIFEISLEKFILLIKLPCRFCGGDGGGLDRIDSSRGYTDDNVQSCCIICNAMKSDLNEQDFLNRVFKIAAHTKS